MHTLALSVDGQLYSWGYGLSGALGQGDSHNRSKPGRVDIPRVVHIAASSVSLAITRSGHVF